MPGHHLADVMLISMALQGTQDDSYFEFALEDYHRVMAGQQASKVSAESGLWTEKLNASWAVSCVYQLALHNSIASAAGEPDDSYFEFTPEDYHRVMAGQQAAKARVESGLRTEKLREQEMRRRAAALGPVPIHVHFPDGLILQVMPLPDSPVGVCAP